MSLNIGNFLKKKLTISEIKKKKHSSMIFDTVNLEKINVHIKSRDDCDIEEKTYYKFDNTHHENNMVSHRQILNQTSPISQIPSHVCVMCNNNSNKDDSFIILGCNHIFHIKCLADRHHYQAKKYHILDDNFFNTRECGSNNCDFLIDNAEISLIHNKFYKSTKDLLYAHDSQTKKLEIELSKIKDELKISMEYKQKLEYEREKSKQIITILNAMD
jgi:hypothetical protein